jgi:Zn-dependent peptidase ImmA (M78 family)
MTSKAELTKAARVAPVASPDRLRLARESHGWTQRALADEMRECGYPISAPALSQLEAGTSTPSAKTLLGLSCATGFPPEFFARRRGDTELPGFFRSLRSAPARERKRALAQAHLLHDFAIAIERHLELPLVDIPYYPLEDGSAEEIENAAERVRRLWRLGDGPLENAVRIIEQHGAITARLDLERHDLDAFSVRFPDRPVVILGGDKGRYARSRFDAAHELGHLVLHSSTDAGEKQAEDQAHRFASAFLLPASSVRHVLPSRANWRELMELKSYWGVSMGALLRRAKDLGVMTDARFVSAMKYMSAKGWRKQEPGDREVAPEQPMLLPAALRQLRQEGISLSALLEKAGLPDEPIRHMIRATTSRSTVRF